MVYRALSHNKRHKTRNGWYSGMVDPIYSIIGAALELALITSSSSRSNIIIYFTYNLTLVNQYKVSCSSYWILTSKLGILRTCI